MSYEKVVIIGAYSTKFGEFYEKSWRDLTLEAGLGVLKDACVGRNDIDEVYIGNMGLGSSMGQNHLGSLVYETFFDGQREKPLPVTSVESACASGSKAFEQGHNSVLAGLYKGKHKIILVGGTEKMKDVKTDLSTRILASASNVEEETKIGKTFPSLYAEIYDRYMLESGAKEEDVHLVPFIDHKNSSKNPKAHFRNNVTLDDIRKSPYVAEPLRLLECSPTSDGSAALILTTESMAKKLGREYAVVKAIESDQDTISLHRRSSITSFRAATKASKRAYEAAGLTPKQIWENGIYEIHDCFSIAGPVAVQDLGLAKRGEGHRFFEQIIETGSENRYNPCGGLKAKGHPVGATGVAQIVEIYDQLRGRSCNQVKNVEYGLAHNIGGDGGTAVVSIIGGF